MIKSGIPPKNIGTVNYDSKGTAGPIASVILGIILLVAGLVSFFMRYEILKQFISSRQRLEEAFYGGNTVGTTLTYIALASGVAMIIGLIILVLGVVKLSKSK